MFDTFHIAKHLNEAVNEATLTATNSDDVGR